MGHSRPIAWRAAALTFTDDPFQVPPEQAMHYESDAILVVEGDRIVAFGPAATVQRELPPGCVVERFAQGLMVPGFIDCHVHAVQMGVVGASGLPLLGWLERHTFPAEAAFADATHARAVARLFLAELQRYGTTTAMVYGSVHPGSVEALFEEAAGSGLRIVAGKAWMDRNAPVELRDTAQSAYDDSRRLIGRWHGRGRLGYAITPRFVATSSPEQLEAAAALWREHPGVHLQSHLAENLDEVAWVGRLFPWARDYVDVLDHHGLLGPRAIYGHAIHLDGRQWQRLAESGTAVAHCPTSNLFLGSGLFDWAAAQGVMPRLRVGLASDVGAGTTLSMLATMAAACQVAQLRGQPLSPLQVLWLATAGAARALGLGAGAGELRVGGEADVVLLDWGVSPWLDWRARRVCGAEELVGVLQTLGDERCVRGVLAGGRVVKRP